MKRIIKSSIPIALVAAATLAVSGCDVVNPGPVQDEFLAQPASQQGLVNGSIRSLAELVGNGAYTMGILAREIFPGGQTGFRGHPVIVQGGHILPGSFGGYFNDAVQARFIAETAIQRFAEAEAPESLMYQAHLWAGYSYRILGEWWCDAVIGSTDPLDSTPGEFEAGTQTYFERAVDNFTAAISFAASDSERYGAYAGRAAAYVWLDDWAAAAADAAMVPDDFVLYQVMDDTDEVYYNHMYEAVSGTIRSYTVQFTYFEDYYTTTGDPRTPWVIDPDNDVATASLQGFAGGAVPYKPQAKYTSRTADVRLSSGAEMRLIEAEAALEMSGDWNAAMALINGVRTSNISVNDGVTPLDPWVANNITEAWSFLKRERYIEFWLEGRRAPDERRWAEDGTPGDLDTPDFESLSTLFSQNERSYCFDIPDAERERNPNVPITGG
jgi:hypothetical protein